LNGLCLRGKEKAGCRWACGLKKRGHEITVLTLDDGLRRAELEQHDLSVRIMEKSVRVIARILPELQPNVVHAHVPGQPHTGDVLGEALKKIPVVQTNVFGRLENPKEDDWTDFQFFSNFTNPLRKIHLHHYRLVV
jgi:hypothetical protein